MEKGKLKIFFGYSAGVGKTYSMLSEARSLRAKGVDVVIGYVEPHARAETMALCEGLEQIPLKSVNYHGVQINEFDLDKALLRRAEIVIVDELAHTNADSAKHKKRYQDVLELLNNGISVFTTVNVQHLEGLNDVIDSATTVKVGETVPDEIFDRADDVELIDIEPIELLERLKSGKVYKGEKIVAALENFFTQEHLNNLREVSMRRCADRIVKNNTLSEITPKILVLISPSPSSQKNIRIAAQMASNYHSKFSAMYVERSGELDDDSAKNLKAHIKLVSDLGGEVIIKYGDSVVETIETYVKINGVTHIIIGKTWQSIGKKVGLEEQIISVLPDIEVLIIPDKLSGNGGKKAKPKTVRLNKFLCLAFCLALVASLGLYFINKTASIIAMSALAVAVFVGFVLERQTKLQLYTRFKQSNRVIDCINLLTMQNSSDGEIVSRIATVLAETFERSALISVQKKDMSFFSSPQEKLVIKQYDSEDVSFFSSPQEKLVVKQYDSEDISFFSSPQEKAILNWCKTNNAPAGVGSDSLRVSNASYFPLELSGSVACIALSCLKSKISVTDKMLFSQIKNTLITLLDAM